MSENFTNFIKTTTATSSDVMVIPYGSDENNYINYDDDSNAKEIRTTNSIIQAHSIYISQANDKHSTDDTTYYASLYIKDSNYNSNYKFYIVNDFAIKPHQTFFVEKNITLTPSQCLCIDFLQSGASDKKIIITSSCVEINELTETTDSE